MVDDILAPGRVAIVSGAAGGIGLAACRRFAGTGMRLGMVDIDADKLNAARQSVADIRTVSADDVLTAAIDVSDRTALLLFKDEVFERFGAVNILMNNAYSRTGRDFSDPDDAWQRAMNVNFWAVVAAVNLFLPHMKDQGEPGIIVNTGSIYGVTNPPGSAVYNVTKAALKTYTEALQHELRSTDDCSVSAHLYLPGATIPPGKKNREGALLPEQAIECLIAGLRARRFYIICPDQRTPLEMISAQVLWAANDMVEGRPALSRWMPPFAAMFERGRRSQG